MTAATQDIKTQREKGDFAQYPVKAATQIFGDTMVCIDATGYAVPGADVAGLKFVGIANGGVDNRRGVDGALSVSVRRVGEHEFESSGLALTNVGDDLYIADDKTLALSTAQSILAGKLSVFVSATVARLNPLPVTGAVS
jgi:hypothetical protein